MNISGCVLTDRDIISQLSERAASQEAKTSSVEVMQTNENENDIIEIEESAVTACDEHEDPPLIQSSYTLRPRKRPRITQILKV